MGRLTGKARKLAKVLTHADYRAALRRGGVAAAIEHEPILSTLTCATVIDIGANRGQFALASRRCFPDARIVSFEPLSAPANRFRAVLGHDPQVCLHDVAIGETAGEAIIHVAAADDSSSLLPMTRLQNALFSGTQEVRTETIRVERLEQHITPADIRPPALLKIDVQGYELQTLKGCEPLLGSFAFLYVECSFVELYQGQALAAEVIDYLRQRGFSLQGVYNMHYDGQGRSIQADFLFAPRIHDSAAN
ncbi:MAG: FkbM family methyltransferase [Pirellulales bacterium]